MLFHHTPSFIFPFYISCFSAKRDGSIIMLFPIIILLQLLEAFIGRFALDSGVSFCLS